jgi:putative hemolysin
LNRIELVTKRLVADERVNVPFWIKLNDAFGLNVRIDEKALAHVPRSGPLVIVSNHPLNGVEGIALAATVSRVRPDVKVVMTNLLSVVPHMAENAIFANPYGGTSARMENVAARRDMEDHLKSGKAMIIFPSGTVSGKEKILDKEARDGAWKKGVADLLLKVPETQVLPIFVEGQASHTFHTMTRIADLLPNKLRGVRKGIGAVFHVREIGSHVDSRLGLVVGQAFSGQEVNSWGNAARVMQNLKRITYDLKANRGNIQPGMELARSERANTNREVVERTERVLLPIAEAGDMAVIRAELDAKARMIYDMAPETPNKRMKVFLAKGTEIPNVLSELGRLREITFREVGEGSGKSRDIDQYDPHYYHLVAIDKTNGAIAGAYRLGRIDEIMKEQGYDGVYTSLFFDHSALVKGGDLAVSLELGRSFVVPEYQRSFALLALFGGIGRFVMENPQYKRLMGPVSISNEYSDRSKSLMMAYLERNYASTQADKVHPLTPLERPYERHPDDMAFIETNPDMKMLSKRIEEIEQAEGRKASLPPLIPIYTGLNAKFFKFNFDREFNALDGMIVADLAELSVAQLKNYMGEEGAAKFLEYHSRQSGR